MVSRLAYRDQSRAYLEQANEELARDDLLQASEKGWGAASQIVKAVAEERGWEHIGVIGTCIGLSTLWSPRPVMRRSKPSLAAPIACTSTFTRVCCPATR